MAPAAAAWADPARHGKDFLNLEAELLESVVSQVTKAEQPGVATVEEMQKGFPVDFFG